MYVTVKQTIIKFPELDLFIRDSHKIRGFFGNYFKDVSPLLHNHYEDGKFMYKYPLVQYKVIEKVPTLVGLNEGAELLNDLFLKIDKMVLDDREYIINNKNILTQNCKIDVENKLNYYTTLTLWMALNQKNHKAYQALQSKEEKEQMLEKILIGNILSFFKAVNYTAEEKILAKIVYKEKETKFKEKNMLAMQVTFITNALLPSYIGLGKSVSRGFGTIVKA
jgi:hypothetical protein